LGGWKPVISSHKFCTNTQIAKELRDLITAWWWGVEKIKTLKVINYMKRSWKFYFWE
jgi:hypothetical protein